MEEWKFLYDRKDFQVSNTGKIRSLDREIPTYRNGVHYTRFYEGRILSQRRSKKEPHLFSSIQYTDKNGNRVNKTIYIHKAVADHFVGKPPHVKRYEAEGKAIYATHMVKDYTLNIWTNIRWITQLELIRSQPKRLADPTKAWRTRWAKYVNNYGCAEKPKYNPKLAWENRKKNGSYPYNKPV